MDLMWQNNNLGFLGALKPSALPPNSPNKACQDLAALDETTT